jgi:hypothetical protein
LPAAIASKLSLARRGILIERAIRLTRCRTRAADQDPRPEGVGILRAVSAAARAPDDVIPPARSLVRIGAKLAARASARSDWLSLPLLVRGWIISHQYNTWWLLTGSHGNPSPLTFSPNPQDRPGTSRSFLCCRLPVGVPDDTTVRRPCRRARAAESGGCSFHPAEFSGRKIVET